MRISRMRSGVEILWIILVTLLVIREVDLYSPLRREDVAEGDCILPFPAAISIRSMTGLAFFFQTAMSLQTPFYVPMGSKHLYRSYSTYLLGRPPASQEELDGMNLRIRGSMSFRWITMGYKNSYFYQQCIPQGGTFFRTSCFATRGSEGTDLDIIRQTTDTLVYTDNKSVFLLIRCVLGRENDWKVLSTKPEVDPEVKAKVLEKIIELGFTNQSYWAEHKYHSFTLNEVH